MTSCNGDAFRITGPPARGIHRSPVDSPYKGPVMRSVDVLFVASLNKLLNKQSSGRWFETPWRSSEVRNEVKWIGYMIWRHFPHNSLSVRGNHHRPQNSLHKGPKKRIFDVFCAVTLSNQSNCRWCQTFQRPLEVYVMNSVDYTCNRDHFVYAASQWETTLHCYVVSHCRRIHKMIPVMQCCCNNWTIFECPVNILAYLRCLLNLEHIVIYCLFYEHIYKDTRIIFTRSTHSTQSNY